MRQLLGLLLLLFIGPATAHNLAPGLLDIQADSPGHYRVLWRTDRRSNLPPPVWPHGCVERQADHRIAGRSIELRLQLHCPQELGDRTVSLDGLGASRTTVLLRYRDGQAQEWQHLLSEESPAARIPAQVQGSRLWWRYLHLGFEHILAGADHLLLVLGLFLLAPGWRWLLLTTTAFTAGHSLTLLAASIDGLWIPAATVELAIALSILYLAMMLSRDRPEPGHWWLFGGFGLVHGLGFAGALSEFGLPAQDRVPALLCFNLGIEAGQLLVLLLLCLGGALLRRPADGLRLPLRWAAIYGLGSLACFWTLDRGWILLS